MCLGRGCRTDLVTKKQSDISNASATAAGLSQGMVVRAMPAVSRPKGHGHGLRCWTVPLEPARAHVKLGLAIDQLVFSFQRRVRDLRSPGAGGQHSRDRTGSDTRKDHGVCLFLRSAGCRGPADKRNRVLSDPPILSLEPCNRHMDLPGSCSPPCRSLAHRKGMRSRRSGI
jgi:hypothetical protein